MLTSSLLLFDIFTNLVTQALSVKATMMNITRGCLYNCLLSLLFAQHGRSEDISIINLKMALHSQSLLWPPSLQTAASKHPFRYTADCFSIMAGYCEFTAKENQPRY